MNRSEETICAPATAIGGAISVIRISGPESLNICSKIFIPLGKKVDIIDQKGFTLLFGSIEYDGEIVDEVLVSIFRSPKSYTGEDSVEISCHASSYIVKRILELIVMYGAVAATPGEFTMRAFLNGRVDLSQAESVADLVASTTSASHRVAINQMRGGFASEIGKLRHELLNFASLIELELDFGEEDVEFADRNQLKAIVSNVKDIAVKLSDSFRIGNVIKNGIPVVIVGKPNTGKSTLLNALLMEERAIVSDIPGTTRDSIEDTIVIDGLEYRFIDTAGLRETSDVVETLGIKKTHEKITQASVVLLVCEIKDSFESVNESADLIRKINTEEEKRLIIVINKTDLGYSEKESELQDKVKLLSDESLLFISAKNKSGLEELKKELGKTSLKEKLDSESVIITNIRHYEAMLRVSESLERVISGLDNQMPEDIIAIDIRQAIHYLGEITGEITSDEILGNIFKNFCIGK